LPDALSTLGMLRQLAALDGHIAPYPVPERDRAHHDAGDDHSFSLPAKRTEAGTRSPSQRLIIALFLMGSAIAGVFVFSGHPPLPTLIILSIIGFFTLHQEQLCLLWASAWAGLLV